MRDPPHRHPLLGVVEPLDGAQEIRQRGLRVPADESEEDPRSQQRRLGVPAFLGEISPDWRAAGRQQQQQQGGPEEGGRLAHRRRFHESPDKKHTGISWSRVARRGVRVGARPETTSRSVRTQTKSGEGLFLRISSVQWVCLGPGPPPAGLGQSHDDVA